MKVTLEQLFSQHTEHFAYLQSVVEYVSAAALDTPLFQQVSNISQAWINEQHPQSDSLLMYRAYADPARFVSKHFFVKMKQQEGARLSLGIIDAAFEFLATKGVIHKVAMIRPAGPQPINLYGDDAEYRPAQELRYLLQQELLYNHLFGFPYIVGRYTQSVVKIAVCHTVECVGEEGISQYEQPSLGTGWLLDLVDEAQFTKRRRVVVTNEHVVAGSRRTMVLMRDDTLLPHSRIEMLESKTGADVALIEIEPDLSMPSFSFDVNAEVLQEIITIGYPKVPMSRDAYQLVHRGEINAQVGDMFGNDLLIISARASPGNSGSPVLDDTGRVVGMVVSELFEKADFTERGITPYFACIPAQTIVDAIRQSALWLELQSPLEPVPQSGPGGDQAG